MQGDFTLVCSAHVKAQVSLAVFLYPHPKQLSGCHTSTIGWAERRLSHESNVLVDYVKVAIPFLFISGLLILSCLINADKHKRYNYPFWCLLWFQDRSNTFSILLSQNIAVNFPPFALGTEKLKMSLEFGRHVFLSRLPLIPWCHLRMNTLLDHRVHPSLFDQGEHLPLNVLWRRCTPGTVVGHVFSPPTPAQLSIVPSRSVLQFLPTSVWGSRN